MRESEFPEFVEFFDGRYTMFGDKIEVPAERYEQLAAFPSTLLQMWRHYGFSGFNDGKVWFCDPVAWAPVVEAWMSDRNLAMGTDRCTRSTAVPSARCSCGASGQDRAS